MTLTFFEVFAIVSPVATALISFFAFRRNQKADDSANAREIAKVLTNIEHIMDKLNTLDHKLSVTDERYTVLIERLTTVEQLARGAHRRIDEIVKGT